MFTQQAIESAIMWKSLKTLPHYLENALRLPHFQQHNNDRHKISFFLIKLLLFYLTGIVQLALCLLYVCPDVFFDSYRSL